jgi:hypothetical protein
LFAALVVAFVALSLAQDASARRRRRGAKKTTPAAEKVKAPPFTLERLVDGMTLVHVPRAGDEVSVRFGVRAGSLHDPPDKAGIAWLVSRAIFHGSYDIAEHEVPQLARRHGVRLDVDVSTTWTTFRLDGPAESFLPVMEKWIALITNPMLQHADLDRARRAASVAKANAGVEQLRWAVDQLAFPSDNEGRTLHGTASSRGAVTQPDLVRWYGGHFGPSNTVVVVVGSLDLVDVKETLRRAVMWPPAAPPDSLASFGDPNVPATARVRADVTATALAYHLGEIDQESCEAVARLLELRTLEPLVWRDPVAEELNVECTDARGHAFVTVFARTRDGEGGRLPDLLAETLESSASKPLTRAERSIILARHANQLAMIGADGSRLADAIIGRALERDTGLRESIDALWRKPRLQKKRLRQVMQSTLTPDNRALVLLSPFRD